MLEQASTSPEEAAGAATVYERIRSKILRNEIPPDTRLSIDGLAREVGTSPTPIREALRHLQGDNLVVQEPGRGYRSTPLLNQRELRELFEFRLLVEPWATKAAAQDRLSNPTLTLERELDELTELIAAKADVRYDLMDHDIRFHDAIFVAADNEVLHAAYSQRHCHLHAFRMFPNDYNGSYTVAEHRAVLNAIKAHDQEAAEQAMRDHLTAAYLRFERGHKSTDGPPRLPGLHPDRPAHRARLTD